MATEPNNTFINTFIKGMNGDIAVDNVQNGQYTFAQNYRIQTQTSINQTQTVNDGSGAIAPVEYGKVFETPFTSVNPEVLATTDSVILAADSINDNGVVIIKDSLVEDDEYTWVVYHVKRVDDHISYNRVFGIYTENGVEKHVSGATTKLSKFSIALDQPQEDVLNLYIADGVHHMMVINVFDDDFKTCTDVQQIEFYASYPKQQAIVDSLISGSLKTSQVTYQYRFYKKYGIISTLSPETKPLQIIAQNRLTEKGCAEDTNTQLGVRLRLPNSGQINSLFDHVQLFRIQQLKPDDVKVFLVADRKIKPDQAITIDDIGTPSELQEYSIDEFNALSSLHVIPMCIETAQNRLFCGNITDSTVLHDNTLRTHTYSKSSDNTIQLLNDDGDIRSVSDIEDVDNIVSDGYYKNTHRGVNDNYSNDGSIHPDGTIIGGSSQYVDWKLVYTSILLDEQEDLLNSTEAKAHTNDISTDICYSDGSVCEAQKKYYETICNPTTITDATYNYVFASSYIRSLRRGETYRYGVMFYTVRGERTSVMWIDDIKVPSEDEIPSTTFENGKLYAHPIGIQFSINLPQESKYEYVQYQIVRCAKIPEYTRDLYQAVVNPTMHNSLPNASHQMSPWYAMPFLLTHPLATGGPYFITNVGTAHSDQAWTYRLPDDVQGNGQYVHTLMSEDINIKRQSTLQALSSDEFSIRFIKNKTVGSVYDFSTSLSAVQSVSDPTFMEMWFKTIVASYETTLQAALDKLHRSNIEFVENGINRVFKDTPYGRIPTPDYKYWYIPNYMNPLETVRVYKDNIKRSDFIIFRTYANEVLQNIQQGVYTASQQSTSDLEYIITELNKVPINNTEAYELFKVGNGGSITDKYYLLTWWYGANYNDDDEPLSTANIAKGINSVTNKTSDGFQFAYYEDGDSSFNTITASAFGDTKQPQWNDGFDNKKLSSNNKFITTFSKKYQQFDTTLNNCRYVNWFAGGKYDLGGKDYQYGVNKAHEDDDSDYNGDWSYPSGSLNRDENYDPTVEMVVKGTFRSVNAYGWIGPGPISLMATTNKNEVVWQQNAPDYVGCYVCAISHPATQFAGDTSELRQYDTYYGHGNYSDINKSLVVFDGEIYIAPAEITSLYKAYDFESSNDSLESMQVVNYVPMESVINPYLEYGLNYRNTGSKNIMTEPGEIVGVATQDRPAYSYNDVYSCNDTTSFIYEPETVDSDTTKFQARILYSDEQQAADSINVKGVFKPLNYIDTETKYGPITHLLAIKDTLYVWQTGAFAKLSINERSLVKDENSNTIQLGQGGVLQRTDYLSQHYGMREYDHAAIGVDGSVYWLDMINNVVAYFNGNTDALSTKLQVQNYLNENINHDIQVQISYDTQYKELLCKCLNDGKQLVFNLSGPYAVGVFTRDYHATIYLTSVLYGICTGRFVQHNNIKESEKNMFLTPTILQFVVNGVPTTTKTFDNQQINVLQKSTYFGLDLNFMANKTFVFETDLHNNFETEMMRGQRISAREGNIQYAIPRADNEDYGNRMRGKWMKVTMTDTNPEYDYAISHIITKFRQSFS